jgi:protein TonB
VPIAESRVFVALAIAAVAIAAIAFPASGYSQTASNATALPESFQSYANRLVLLIAANRAYPRAARIQGVQGSVVVALTLDRNGRLLESHIFTSSGSDILDEAALGTVRRSQPFPPFPSDYPKERADFRLPLRYVLPPPAPAQ